MEKSRRCDITFGRLKSAISLLLIGDNELPEDHEQLLAALEMAYIELAGQTTALKLLTVTAAVDIIRQGPGGTYIRMPRLPEEDSDELDIDSELSPAVARLIASYVSREKGQLHAHEAQKVIKAYESKVRVFIEENESEGAYVEIQDDYASARVGN